ncbi:acyltransferase [Streptomyces sp. NPDC051907]|uniref:acyltransferase family protein n=1 Tax=Streptomyces sp. NPDC051907 TaxID=3155284 RepID=UPI003438B34A
MSHAASPAPASDAPDAPAAPARSHRAPSRARKASGASAPGRDRYLDLLRSLALVRVVVYHIFGWAWLTILFPSMGVMFALAGSLMARSLSRPALGVIRGRIRRLLPPLWAFAAFLVPAMFLDGWKPDAEAGLWWWADLLNYLLPIGAPPFPWSLGDQAGLVEQSWAAQAGMPLWYLRTYLWFVVASPLLLWAFRKAPWATLLAPLALTAVVGTNLVKIPGEVGSALVDFATFGACWVLGFAHQSGLLKEIPRHLVVSCSALVMAFGLWWASGHLGPDGWDLNDIPLAQATWSFGFVAILLLYSPSWQQLPGRLARFDRHITLSNNRAVTIYLWHNTLIMTTIPLIDLLWHVPFVEAHLGGALESTYTLWMLVLIWPLIGLAIVGVGWIEDLAAQRRPRLWPNGSRKR